MTTRKVDRNHPPIHKGNDAPSFADAIALVRRAVKAQQRYTESLEPTIELCAGSYVAYRKIMSAIDNRKNVSYVMPSGERKLYPELSKFADISDNLRKQLKALGLTVDTLLESDEDPLQILTECVNQAMQEDGETSE